MAVTVNKAALVTVPLAVVTATDPVLEPGMTNNDAELVLLLRTIPGTPPTVAVSEVERSTPLEEIDTKLPTGPEVGEIEMDAVGADPEPLPCPQPQKSVVIVIAAIKKRPGAMSEDFSTDFFQDRLWVIWHSFSG